MATDSFTRADSSDLGANWDVLTGWSAGNIVSNEAISDAPGREVLETWNADTAPDDQFSKMICREVIPNANKGTGVAARCAVGANTCYFVFHHASGAGKADLQKVVAGSFASLGTFTGLIALNDEQRIEAEGTTIRYKQNGTQRISVTDAAIASGRWGICLFSSSGASRARGDDWEGGSLAGGTTVLPTPLAATFALIVPIRAMGTATRLATPLTAVFGLTTPIRVMGMVTRLATPLVAIFSVVGATIAQGIMVLAAPLVAAFGVVTPARVMGAVTKLATPLTATFAVGNAIINQAGVLVTRTTRWFSHNRFWRRS